MNAGLSNLATLKAWLLPAAMVAGTDYDAQILTIGKGVATQLEKHCNRQFLRTVGATFECEADRLHVVLPRFPVEVITTIEQRDSLADGWVAQTINDLVENQDLEKGMLFFGAMPGFYPSRLRLTYTGGYWFDLLEPDAMGYPTAQPSGSAAVPPDLLHAWLLLSESVWKTHDKLGLAIAEKPGAGGGALLGLSLPGLDIPSVVQKILQPYIRYTLT